ncbi:uncharacterized protein EAF01_003882 [Botrytis porri]|uniref:Uncharacterized protein n=1 Tax=Botrytis porri TaxID=87229 RepID=A0A4Z1KZS4_9HELO|nr:uncharacterized protein EAF01_003882 [Botrytis porri]KAF7908127.1 hypothetical protein EAF01_003882 [Botrytis porri]TGO90105.1 hypothetical protein BPOR_0079g00180 [Botrytis porri]
MSDVNMEEGRNDDSFSLAQLGIKQRIEQAKLRAAERRAREAAARRVEQAPITPSRSSFPASPSITNSLPSTSDHASTANLLLRSPTTNHERVERAKTLEALSKKIDGAGNFKLQELIMIMILQCPGAKYVAESFFVSDGVESDNGEDGEKERDDTAQLEDAEVQNSNHVIHTRDHRTSIALNVDQNRGDSLETQASSGSPATIVPNQQVGEANARQESDPPRLHPNLSPEDASILHNSEAAYQPSILELRSRSDSVDSQGLVDRQLLPILNSNSQKTPRAIDDVGLETTSTNTTTEAVHTPNCVISKEIVSGTDISKALDTLLSSVAKSRGITANNNSASATPQFTIPGAMGSVTTSVTNDRPQDDILQLANGISVRYLALARASGVANFPYDQLASIRAGSPRNVSTQEFSFEAFNSLVDNFRRNIESTHEGHANNEVLGKMRSKAVREGFSDDSDLGSPIPIDINGQELERNSVRVDSVDPDVDETMAMAKSTDSEEEDDEYGFLDNMPSSHYNCDSCRKPIVLPEGSIISLMSLAPTTCLHCKTRKAAGITRRRLGAGSRSRIVAESPIHELSNRLSLDREDQPVTDTSFHSSKPVAETSAPLPEARSEPLPVSLPEPLSEPLRELLPDQLPEPLPELLSESPREPLVENIEHLSHSIEIEDSDSGETPRDSGSGDAGNVKQEYHRGTLTVELPRWPSSASQCRPANQFSANSQISPRGMKHKVEYIEGEAIYSSPIGPKRRRGRPLKDYHAIVLDSSPANSSQASTPTSRRSSQVGLSGKKRGRPFGSKNSVKPEAIDHNQPTNDTGIARPTGQRQSARKTREILRNIFSEELDFMKDATSLSGVPAQIQINTRSAAGSTVSDLQATPDRVIPTNRRARRDFDPDYMPTWELENRSGTISNDNSTLSSIGGAVSNISNESGTIDNTLIEALVENSRERGTHNPLRRSSEYGTDSIPSSHRLNMSVRRQDGEFPVAQSSISDQEQSRSLPPVHPSGLSCMESLQPGRGNLAGRTPPGEPLTDSSLSSTLPVGTLPWNTFNQNPDLTALPASSPTVQSLQERTPKVCCGNRSCRFNSRCEKKPNRRERKKQRRLNELLSQERQW